jgi:hypothetical protein
VAILPTEWNKVATAYQTAASALRNISEAAEIKQIKHVISLSADQWQQLSKVIDKAKTNYAGNNVLPEI